MGIYDELSNLGEQSPSSKGIRETSETPQPENKSIDKPIKQSTYQPTSQSTGQSTNQLVDPLSDAETLGSIVARPRAFYITQKIDRWLDKAVLHLQEKGLHKMDRSVLVNGLLHDPELYKPKNLDKNWKRFLAHLTNKMLKRSGSSDE